MITSISLQPAVYQLSRADIDLIEKSKTRYFSFDIQWELQCTLLNLKVHFHQILSLLFTGNLKRTPIQSQHKKHQNIDLCLSYDRSSFFLDVSGELSVTSLSQETSHVTSLEHLERNEKLLVVVKLPLRLRSPEISKKYRTFNSRICEKK